MPWRWSVDCECDEMNGASPSLSLNRWGRSVPQGVNCNLHARTAGGMAVPRWARLGSADPRGQPPPGGPRWPRPETRCLHLEPLRTDPPANWCTSILGFWVLVYLCIFWRVGLRLFISFPPVCLYMICKTQLALHVELGKHLISICE